MPSRLCGKCSECANKYNCNNKRMEAFGYLKQPTSAQSPTVNISINSENLNIDKLAKQIEKRINSRCYFNK